MKNLREKSPELRRGGRDDLNVETPLEGEQFERDERAGEGVQEQ